MERVAIGLLGLGTVGAGVARLLESGSERIARRTGRRVDLKWAVVRNPDRPRDCALSSDRIVTDPRLVLDDPEIRVVVEAIGGTEPALAWILAALAAGKDVVTANKALLAEHGAEVCAQARKFGRAVAFEASVAGGIPIVQALSVGLASNQVQNLSAIVNGTCNFILSSMGVSGVTYEAALAEAQFLGYAEADPTLDVDGTDTAHKLAILAQIAFGASVTTNEIPRRGIDQLQAADIRYAGELGYTVKLLALAKLSEGGLELRVAPTLVRRSTPLAEVKGPYNAIRIVGDAVGDTLFYGRGAGGMPTASSVVADLMDVLIGRAALTFRSSNFWPEGALSPTLASSTQIRSRYYLRFSIADRPGVIGAVAQSLGRHGISIASVIQHDPGDDDHPGAPVPLVIMTHSAVEADVVAAIAEIDGLDAVRAPSVCLGVEE
ncbi:MAG: homoserine dehydrogenase [Planctomycetota bacterium]|nr:homoserine dehydrogenase [Planctomycetota bacterium]